MTTCKMSRAPCSRIPTRTPHACTWYEEGKQIQEGPPTNNIVVGNRSGLGEYTEGVRTRRDLSKSMYVQIRAFFFFFFNFNPPADG